MNRTQRKIFSRLFFLSLLFLASLLAKPTSVIATENCERLAGNGPHKVVFMRGQSTLNNYNSYTKTDGMSDSDFRWLVTNVIENGFYAIDPFKTYSSPYNVVRIERFSFYIQKPVINDSQYPENVALGDDSKITWSQSVDANIINQTSCTNDIFTADDRDYYTRIMPGPPVVIDSDIPERTVTYLFYFAKPGVYLAWSHDLLWKGGGGIALFNLNRRDWLYLESTPYVDMHEFGHAFAYLFDEYSYSPFGSIWNESWNGSTENCTFWPYRDYHGPDNKIYGSTSSIGCSYIYRSAVFSPKGGPSPYYRPSSNSIMNKESIVSGRKFNVISCGYIMARIVGDLDYNSPSYSGFGNTFNLPLTKKRAEIYWPKEWYFTVWKSWMSWDPLPHTPTPEVRESPGCEGMDTIKVNRPAVSLPPLIRSING